MVWLHVEKLEAVAEVSVSGLPALSLWLLPG